MTMEDRNYELLSDPQRGVDRARDLLSAFYRQILKELNIKPFTWARLMERHMNNPRVLLSARGKNRASYRGNLRRALLKDTMTWKVFERGILFLGPRGARFTIVLEWPDGRETVHETRIDLSNVELDEAEADAGDQQQDE